MGCFRRHFVLYCRVWCLHREVEKSADSCVNFVLTDKIHLYLIILYKMSEILGVCLSCANDKNTYNIFDTHECEGREEIYADMLKSCFNIVVSKII